MSSVQNLFLDRRRPSLRRTLPIVMAAVAGVAISVISNRADWSDGTTLAVALGALTIIAVLGLPLALLPFDRMALSRHGVATPRSPVTRRSSERDFAVTNFPVLTPPSAEKNPLEPPEARPELELLSVRRQSKLISTNLVAAHQEYLLELAADRHSRRAEIDIEVTDESLNLGKSRVALSR